MTQRELSEKLYKLATEIESIVEGNVSNTASKRVLSLIADELHELSSENYTPGSTSWADLNVKSRGASTKSKKQPYANKAGRPLPF